MVGLLSSGFMPYKFKNRVEDQSNGSHVDFKDPKR